MPSSIQDAPLPSSIQDAPQDAAPTDADDLDAWLAGIKRRVVEVEICGDAEVAGEIEALQEKLRLQTLTDIKVAPDDRGQDWGGRADELAEQIGALHERARASVRTFRVVGLSEDEQDTLRRKHSDLKTGEVIDPDAHLIDTIVEASQDPKLTREQVSALRSRLNAGEFRKLWTAVLAATNEAVPVPLS